MTLRKRFGQHFLRDGKIIGEFMRRMRPQAGESILEIGPGDGALTAEFLAAGAALTAVEIDRDLAEKLRARFGGRLNLIVGDALAENLSALLDGGRAAGNLPYNISTPLLLKLAESGAREMWLMMQEEVAARVCAPPGGAEYGRLTVSLGLFYRAEKKIFAPPRAFSPPPKVNSAVVKFSRRASPPPLSPSFSAVLAAAFQSRRKMLGNGLSAFSVNWRAAEIDPSRRPQTLSPEEFARLSLNAEPRA